MNTALEALSQALKIECCWIQTISDRRKQGLSLAAARGFSDAMRSEITAIDLDHDFGRQIIGIGRKIIVPDLGNNGTYSPASFKKSGYKWLVAVPLMTYRVYGILGTASRNKKRLDKDTAALIMVIGGLIAGALSKAHLSRSFHSRRKPPVLTVTEPEKETPPADIETEIAPDTPAAKPEPQKNPPKTTDPAFHSHKRKMETFRKSHG